MAEDDPGADGFNYQGTPVCAEVFPRRAWAAVLRGGHGQPLQGIGGKFLPGLGGGKGELLPAVDGAGAAVFAAFLS